MFFSALAGPSVNNPWKGLDKTVPASDSLKFTGQIQVTQDALGESDVLGDNTDFFSSLNL